MRLTLEFNSDNNICLPIHYNHCVESFLYRNISPELGKFLHDRGFTSGKRRFKMFTFSRIYGKYKLMRDKINFYPPASLLISSPLDRFINELGNALLKNTDLELLENKIHLESIRVHPEPENAFPTHRL